MNDVTLYVSLGPKDTLTIRELDGGRLLLQSLDSHLDKGLQFHGVSIQLVLDPVHVRALLARAQAVAA